MSGTTRRLFSAGAVALCLGLMAFSAVAAPINYGDYNVPTPPSSVDFLQVTENSGTDTPPLYGAPDPFAVGLDFDPTSFTANSAGGGADITDGQLNFTVMGNPFPPQGVVAIQSITLFEAGDYTLAGAGGAGTAVAAGAIMRATVTEIDGVAVAPIALTPVNASFSDSLPGLQVATPWSLGMVLDVAGQLAPGSFIVGATKVEVVVNNVLVAQSEAQSAAFIAKKDFRISIEEIPGQVPEPATAGMALLALAGLAAARRRS